MKRRVIGIMVLGLLAFVLVSVARAADLKDPLDIIAKSKAKTMGLKSYSYRIVAEGWDMNVAETMKKTQALAGEASSKFGSKATGAAKEVAAKDTKPQYKKYNVSYKFMKPFLLQMFLTQSDYVPKILYSSLMTYRPDQDKSVWWFKLRFSPVALKRDIKSESGNFLYSGMLIHFIQMEMLGKDTKPVLQGVKKVGGRDCYVVAFVFDKKKQPKAHPVDYNKWGIPKEVRYKFQDEAPYYTKHSTGKVVYYIDKATMLISRVEDYGVDGKKLYTKEFRDFKTNNLTEKDF
jgi:hypothetical protein